jgi:hypothetical protein
MKQYPLIKDFDPRAVGFKSGLEIHQQIQTDEKLFCHCPAGLYSNEYHTQILRHMRPTLSELGEYDGTALIKLIGSYDETEHYEYIATGGIDVEADSILHNIYMELSTTGGGFTEISAIASGNLTVNGDVISRNMTVSKDQKDVGQARICLIAGEDTEEGMIPNPRNIYFNGDEITVQAHGKYETTADIRISATGNVEISARPKIR